jgi:glycosyltransferase involved in cell wall biosynthesis
MLIQDYWPSPEGGAERQCRGLVRCLSRLGVQSEVWTVKLVDGNPAQEIDGPSLVRRLGISYPRSRQLDEWLDCTAARLWPRNEGLRHAAKFWIGFPLRRIARQSFIREALRLVRASDTRADVVHVHETGWLAGVGAELAAYWSVPLVCKVRNTPALEIIGYDVPERRRLDLLRLNANYVALHHGLADELRQGRIPDGQISIIPNGTDVTEEVPFGARDSYTVLYVGNFSQGAAHKGFDDLIRVWAQIHKAAPQARLVLAGGGNTGPWEALAVSYGCRESMAFLGHVGELGALYKSASLFIFPSRHEGMSNALLEAQAQGLPAVASDITANRAVIVSGETGWLVPVGNVDALADAVLKLLNDPKERARMSHNAWAHIQRTFDRMAVARSYRSLYSRLVEETDL